MVPENLTTRQVEPDVTSDPILPMGTASSGYKSWWPPDSLPKGVVGVSRIDSDIINVLRILKYRAPCTARVGRQENAAARIDIVALLAPRG